MADKETNSHLLPVFSIILPELRNKQIPFWVFGGIAISGIKGEFLRRNEDVDIFVLETDYHGAKDVLGRTCSNFSEFNERETLCGKRPKFEILTGKDEIFSMVPVYKGENEVEFVFPNGGTTLLSLDVLTPVERKLNGFVFNTPGSSYLIKLFENHLQRENVKDNPRLMEKYEIDRKFLDSLNMAYP